VAVELQFERPVSAEFAPILCATGGQLSTCRLGRTTLFFFPGNAQPRESGGAVTSKHIATNLVTMSPAWQLQSNIEINNKIHGIIRLPNG